MHRFHLPPERCQGPILALDAGQAHHASRVLRLQPGAPAIVLDGAGREWHCEIASIARQAVELHVRTTHTSPPPPFQLTLLQAIPKGKLMDLVVQKATELGATRIVPLLAERVVTQLDEQKGTARAEHWRQVAIEAIKQCGSAWLPTIDAPIPLDEWCARRESFDLALLASLEPERTHPRRNFDAFQKQHGRLPQSCALYIGPEGDFTAKEIAALKAAGAQPISLGRLVLRTETAALCGLSVLSYEWEAQRATGPARGSSSPDVPDA
jgi:16S rRNA (uracil1498-N3)-methyltransferase